MSCFFESLQVLANGDYVLARPDHKMAFVCPSHTYQLTFDITKLLKVGAHILGIS